MAAIKIMDSHGVEQRMSGDLYVIKDSEEIRGWLNNTTYYPGMRVRLISGIDGSKRIGYHFSKGFVTICNASAPIAEFVGLKREWIELAHGPKPLVIKTVRLRKVINKYFTKKSLMDTVQISELIATIKDYAVMEGKSAEVVDDKIYINSILKYREITGTIDR